MKQWFVVYTQANGELKAAANLRNQGYLVYLPVYEKLVRHARRSTVVRRPFFPRYLFVEMDVETTSWRSINGTVGVSHLICNGDRPAPVPEGVVAAVQEREGCGGAIQMEPTGFVKGEAVRFVDGPWSDVTGFLKKCRMSRGPCCLFG